MIMERKAISMIGLKTIKIIWFIIVVSILFGLVVYCIQSDFVQKTYVSLVWLVLVIIVSYRIILSRRIEFDDHKIYFSDFYSPDSFKYELPLERISKIKTSYFGYFVIIEFYVKKPKRIFTLNTSDLAAKYDRSDVSKINSRLFKSTEVDYIEELREKIRHRITEIK